MLTHQRELVMRTASDLKLDLRIRLSANSRVSDSACGNDRFNFSFKFPVGSTNVSGTRIFRSAERLLPSHGMFGVIMELECWKMFESAELVHVLAVRCRASHAPCNTQDKACTQISLRLQLDRNHELNMWLSQRIKVMSSCMSSAKVCGINQRVENVQGLSELNWR